MLRHSFRGDWRRSGDPVGGSREGHGNQGDIKESPEQSLRGQKTAHPTKHFDCNILVAVKG